MKKMKKALRTLKEERSRLQALNAFHSNSSFSSFTDLKLSRLLFEQDEEEGAEEDLFGTDEEEPAEEGGDEEAGAEEGGEEGGDEEAGAEEGGEEEETVEIKPGDEVRFGKQLDAALDSMLADFEMAALKSAAVNAPIEVEEEIQIEWWNTPLAILLEQEEVVAVEEESVVETDFDVESFAEDVGRLIQNYDSLLDMEGIIFNKAMDFLQTKYGEDVASTFSEILELRYNLYLGDAAEDNPNDTAAPLGVGASGGGEMGGGA